MATITLKGNPIHTSGNLPVIGSRAPDFTLLRQDLSTAQLGDYAGKRKVLNIFPSIDTPVCAQSTRTFHQHASDLPNTVVLNISADLPFAHNRFCTTEGIKQCETLSTFRSTFATDWGIAIADGALTGLCARAVVVLDTDNTVRYVELVPEIAQEPNYDAALAAARK